MTWSLAHGAIHYLQPVGRLLLQSDVLPTPDQPTVKTLGDSVHCLLQRTAKQQRIESPLTWFLIACIALSSRRPLTELPYF